VRRWARRPVGPAWSGSMAATDLSQVSMDSLVETVLPFRSSQYISDLCEKLLGEGIASAADLLICSKEALENKLATHAAFNFIEMADAITLRKSIDRTGKNASPKPERRRSPQRGRSRSPPFRGRQPRNSSGGQVGMRDGSRPHRGRGRDDVKPPQRIKKDPPELWAAVEKGDEVGVQDLLAAGKDPEEKFEGWSPLMKAAEEGHVDILEMLLAKKVNIEACNRKSRTALSFAAAPSMKGKTPRATPVEALRLLLQNGADARRKDDRGLDPKDYATREKREDALGVLAEFGF
jgi:hypothetical protein